MGMLNNSKHRLTAIEMLSINHCVYNNSATVTASIKQLSAMVML